MATTTINDYAAETTAVNTDEFLLQATAGGAYAKITRANLIGVSAITHATAYTASLLNQTISNPPTQAQVQAISDKTDAQETQIAALTTKLNALIDALQLV